MNDNADVANDGTGSDRWRRLFRDIPAPRSPEGWWGYLVALLVAAPVPILVIVYLLRVWT